MIKRSITILFLALAAISVGSVCRADQERFLLYGEFIKEVEAGQVESVSVGSSGVISGTYQEGAPDATFRCYVDSGSANDVLLRRLLDEHGVELLPADQQEDRWSKYMLWSGLFMVVAPLLTLLLVWRTLARVKRMHKEMVAMLTPYDPTSTDEEPQWGTRQR